MPDYTDYQKKADWRHIDHTKKILIYSITGLLKDEITIGNDIESIEAGPRENILFLYNNEKAAVQILTFDFVQKINISGSPFIGNPEAPVVIVVFTDYQ